MKSLTILLRVSAIALALAAPSRAQDVPQPSTDKFTSPDIIAGRPVIIFISAIRAFHLVSYG